MTDPVPGRLDDDSSPLRRVVSLPVLTFYGLGNILGAGIYVLVGKVAGVAGMFAPWAFIGASLVALFSAMTYAELTARYPYSAGPAVYVAEGLRSRILPRVVGMLVALSGCVSAATLTRGFYGYFTEFIVVPEWLSSVVLIALLGALVAWGISQSTRTAALLTWVELAGLVLVVWVAREAYATLPERIDEMIPPASFSSVALIAPAAFLAFYAFLGFEDIVNIAEEVDRPQRNLPLAIGFALILSTLFYLLVSVVAVLAIEPSRLAASDAPLLMLYSESGGAHVWLFGLIGIAAVVNGIVIQMIMVSRIFYGMACNRWLPRGLARVSPGTRTPLRATLVMLMLVLVLAILLPLQQLAAMTSLLILCVFALVNSALIAIKLREVMPPRSIQFPLWIPVAGLLTALGLVAAWFGLS